MRIFKNVSKRMLSLVLAFLMLVSLIPAQAMQVHAAEITGLTDTSIALSVRDGDPGKWTAAGTTITGSVSGTTSGSGCNATTSTQTTTLTITNKNETSVLLAFNYDNAGVTFDGPENVSSGNTYKGLLGAEESLAVALTSPPGKDKTATVQITDIAVTLAMQVDTTFLPAENGSYTVDGNTITAQTQKNNLSTEGYVVTATANEGYRFVGWYNVTSDAYIAYNASETLFITSNATIRPVFESDADAFFGVDDRRFNELNVAAGYAATVSSKQVNLIKDATLPAGEYVIPKGVTLLIPFDSANTCYKASPKTNARDTIDTPYAYRTLTLAADAELIIHGEMSIGAQHGRAAGSKYAGGAPSGPCGFVRMADGSKITVKSGGVLYAWGYITGLSDGGGRTVINNDGTVGGSISVESGGAVHENFQLAEYRGGTAMVFGYSGVDLLPFSQYYIQNIEVPLTIYAGATEYGYCTAYMKPLLSSTSQEFPVTMAFIGSGGMFNLTSGSITKQYMPRIDRLELNVNGDISFSSVSLNIGVSVDSSDYVLPINSNITININSGTASIKQDTTLLPGAKVKIAEGAAVQIESKYNLYVFDRDDWVSKGFVHAATDLKTAAYSPSWTYTRTSADLVDAVIDVNGTLSVVGNFYTTLGGANITSSAGTGTVIYNANAATDSSFVCPKQSGSDVTKVPVTAKPAWLLNADGTYTETAGAESGDNFVYSNGKWVKAKEATITYHAQYNDENGAEVTATQTVSMDTVIAGQRTDLNANPFVREHYTFQGWAESADATEAAYTDGASVLVTDDLDLYAIWEGDPHKITYQDGEQSVAADVAYGDTVTLSVPSSFQKTGYTLTGWDSDGDGVKNYDPNAEIVVQGDLTLTAIWEINQYQIVFNTDGGDAIETITANYGAEVTIPTPTKVGSAFLGWYANNGAGSKVEVGTITMPENGLQLKATWQVNTYTITWLHEDGTPLGETTVEHGTVPTFTVPSKDMTAEEVYTFAGWVDTTSGSAPVAATGNATYKASFTKAPRKYAISWDTDGNGVVDVTEEVAYGTVPSAPAPNKANTAKYTYTFTGWDKEIVAVIGDATYTAKYDSVINKYKVTWVDGDGNTLLTSEVKYDDIPEYEGADPTKTETAEFAYTWSGWDKKIVAVTGDVTYTATFDGAKKSYAITWVDGNGNALKTDTVAYGEVPEYSGAEPTKKATAQYSYTWNEGWDPEVVAVTGVATYTATFDETVNEYTVTWIDGDGKTLTTDTVAYGTIPVYTGETPTKTGTQQYSYTWNEKWDKEVVAVTGNVTYTATFDAVVNSYTVTWIDGDGKTLTTDTVAYGTVPTYSGKTPTKTATAQYSYSWTEKWDKEVVAVTGDTDYTATFDSTVNQYTVTWKMDDGTVLKEELVDYGSTPSHADPSKTEDKQYSYAFAGWDADEDGQADTLSAVTGDVTYVAIFTGTLKSYTITWLDDEGNEIDTTSVEYGKVPTHDAPTKAATKEYTYTFAGWSPALAAVTGDTEYRATFTATKNSYTITWKMDDGSLIDTTTVEYGVVPSHAEPSKDATAEYTYTFAGWSPALVAVTGDAEYKAAFTATKNSYTINWLDENGTPLDTTSVEYGTIPVYPNTAPTKAATAEYTYAFAGWTPEIVAVTGTATYRATYTATPVPYTITFKDTDGTEIATITQGYGTEITKPDDPTKDGYAFVNWDTEIPETMPAENLTITATWKANQYTISFNADGGSDVQSITADYLSSINKPADPQKEGHTFLGWYVGEEKTDVPAVMPLNGLELTAKWQINQYTITFDTDGGTTIEPIKQNYGTEIKTPDDPTKTGYTFDSWDTEIPATMPAKDMTIKAQWNINSYTITFYVDGQVHHTEEVVFGTATPTPETPANKDGFRFAGWQAYPAVMPAHAVEVNAIWAENQYAITYNANAGTDAVTGEMDVQMVDIDADGNTVAQLSENAFARTGYTFAGWALTADGEAVYQDKDAVTMTDDLNLYAVWNVNQYKITFANTGDTAIDPIEQDYGTTVQAPAAPKKEGYTFAGWDKPIPGTMPAENVTVTATWQINQYTITFVDTDGKNLHSITEDYGTAITDEMKPADPTKTGYTFAEWDQDIPATMPAKDLTITAKWNINQYTITFDTDGGTVIDPIKQDYNTAVEKPANPTKIGYTFAGWDVDVPAAMPAENLTIKAKWTVNQYTITFDTDGGSAVAQIKQDYGTAVTAPANPTKVGYEFAGWDQKIPTTMPANNLTVKALWTVNKYSITLDTDGDGEADTTITQDYNTEVAAPAVPEKAGHTFAGWYNGDAAVVFPIRMPVDGMALTAAWTINQYSVIYHTNGGVAVGSVTEDYGTKISAPSTTRTGYTLAGWTTEASGTEVIYAVGAEITIQADMDLYAIWTINQYTIHFNTDGGTEIADITQNYRSDVTAPANPTKEGYTFTGWVDANGAAAAVPATMPAANITLKATWRINQYTITFNTDGGSNVAPITQDYGTDITVPAAPTKTGYTFAGWSEDVPATMPAGNKTLTAKWTINQYTVTFVSDGNETIGPETKDYNTTFPAPSATKTGYTFAGWAEEAGGAVIYKAGAAIKVTENKSLYAVWTINQYTITFDTDGGTAVNAIKQDYGTEITAPAAPTKTGYTFAGWSEEVPATMPAGNKTLKAQWTINQYTITFVTNGGTEIAAITQDYDTVVVAPADPTKEGHTFNGWSRTIPGKMPAENLTITANWSVNRYTIRFVTGGGTVIVPITADYGAAITAPANPTRTGYTFVGWDQEIPETMPVGGMTITAQWQINQYTITYNTDGGSQIPAVTADFGTKITVPAVPTKEGYTFAGWDKDLPDTMPADDVTITALWTVNQYTITFHTDGGSTVDPIKQDYNTAIVKPADPTKEGYTFAGWSEAIPETMPAQNKTITAKWTINQYSIKLDTNGDGAADITITQNYGTAVQGVDRPTKEGHTFAGWVDADGEAVQIPAIMPAHDVMLTAAWTVNQYTVTFNSDGGSAVEAVTKNYGEQIEAPAEPTKEGHTFTGWVDAGGKTVSFPITVGAQNTTIKASWKANEYSITFVLDEGKEETITQPYGTAVTAPSNFSKVGYSFTGWDVTVPKTMPAKDMTITAQWAINRYTFSFDSNGGSPVTAITRTFGDSVTPPAEPTREGYTFLGWDQEIPATMPAQNMSFTAQWQVNQYTITFLDTNLEPITQDYGTPVVVTMPEKEGYSFSAWNREMPATMPARDLEITALWTVNQYTITFNTAGGDALDPITQDYGTPITFTSSPEREGYTFIAWTPELPKTMPAENITVTAIWTIDTYTITFDTAGGSKIAPIVQQYGTPVTAPENPTREGYIFDGWDIKIPETMPAENLTITADWKPANFTITFVSDGEEVGSVTAEYGSPISPVDVPSRTGYDFAGWEPAIPATMPGQDMVVNAKWTPKQYSLYFHSNGGNDIPVMMVDYGAKIEVPADPVKEGYIFTGWNMDIPETMPAEDLVFVASWKIGSFSITFDTDGGTEIGQIVQNYGTKINAPANPTKTGYTFIGWEPEIPATMPGKDTTIKALWKANQYTLTFNTEGGSQIDPITADFGSPITAPAKPKKEGYTFVGWDKSIPATMPARNMTFNAIWKEGEEPAELFPISFANMTLGNSLKMNFAFEQGHLDDWTGHYATIRKTYADGRPDAVVTIPYAQWGQAGISGKAYFTVSFDGIAAKEMADEVYVTIFNADGEAVSHVWEDSVRAYAMRTLNNPNSTEETMIMVVDMLNYGAAAQNHFGFGTDDLANSLLTEEQAALATPSVTFADSRVADENYYGTNLGLESQILMRVAFRNVTEDMYAVVSFTSHTGKYYETRVESSEFEYNYDKLVIPVDAIVVADGRKPVTVTVYNADGTVHSSVTESMESYIARMSDSDVLYEMIMKFSDSAYNYFH